MRLTALLCGALLSLACNDDGSTRVDGRQDAGHDAPVDSAGEASLDAATDAPLEAAPERRCGNSPDDHFSAYTSEQLLAYADCTVLVGKFQQDSVTELHDFAPLQNVNKIEGTLNVFRSPGFTSLHGFENLQIIEGDLFIHLNENLESILALGKLEAVTGNLFIHGNDRLPQAQVEALAGRVRVGGTTMIE